ncbi:SDR family NAD(P)-dependent oxidoreductase [Nocardia spumae]|uniref:SDR family NAD(P)-dependent oxidoreductase n=1 Tax=Nocardia spumae TaxID=2887190 RepID=UPI001D15C369|nr:SDR family NAD(P)-dependent oxidoreductase [Nocardia spumae]
MAMTWMITGASRGLGRALTEHLLGAGETVVALVRRPDSLDDLIPGAGRRLIVLPHDARHTEAADRVVAAALDRAGSIDVLVNNAGVGVVGATEELPEAELRDLFDLNFFGAVALTKAVLPTMRAAGRGAVVNMSSQGGVRAFPGVGAYCATKFALEGWSEALAGEVAPFGIRVMLVQPSRFRTAFNADSLRLADPAPEYHGSLAAVRRDMTTSDGHQEGDPARAAQIITDVVTDGLADGAELPLRLPLGAEAVATIRAAHERGIAYAERFAELARRADFPDAVPTVRSV